MRWLEKPVGTGQGDEGWAAACRRGREERSKMRRICGFGVLGAMGGFLRDGECDIWSIIVRRRRDAGEKVHGH